MGTITRHGDDIVYQQADGEITAWLTGFEEKRVLVHEGSVVYKRIFHLLVVIGVAYLGAIFWFSH